MDERARGTRCIVASLVAARVLTAAGVAIGARLHWVSQDPPPRTHWFMWDGAFYRDLADRGYDGTGREAVRFFPLYPLLGKVLGIPMLGSTEVALYLVANVAAVVATFLLRRLVEVHTGDAQLATRSAMVFALFPASAVLCLPYGESLLVVLAVAAALLLLDGRTLAASAALFATGLTRPTAVLLALPVGLLALPHLRARDRTALGWVVATAAPIAGLLAFSAWLEATGWSATAPLDIQRQLRAGFHEPVTRLARAVGDVASGHFRDVYNLAFVTVLLVALAVAVRRRYSWPWTAYLGAGLLVALAANNIDSLGRYGVSLAPAWAVGLATLATDRVRTALLLGGCGAGMVALTVLWARGSIVP